MHQDHLYSVTRFDGAPDIAVVTMLFPDTRVCQPVVLQGILTDLMTDGVRRIVLNLDLKDVYILWPDLPHRLLKLEQLVAGAGGRLVTCGLGDLTNDVFQRFGFRSTLAITSGLDEAYRMLS